MSITKNSIQDQEKLAIIEAALQTDEGRVALAQAIKYHRLHV